MQTIKTAAIVVLLMTVIYSAYVSLTTPPEPLSADVQGLVIDDQSLAIDTSLPASLGKLEINTGNAEAFAPVTTIDSGDLAGMELPPSAAPANTFASDSNPPQAAVAGVIAPSNSGVTTQISDLPSNSAVAVNAAPAKPTYPNTSSTFQLPDPSNAPANFTPSPGGVNLPDSVALTSGTQSPNASGPPSSPLVTQADLSESSPPRSASGSNLGLANAIRIADGQYASGKLREALATLSIFYDTPDLSGEDRADLLSRLDPLAREVIYSKRHLLEKPYRVGQKETLVDVAKRFEVPWQLLANINQVQDPITILPGTELKIVRGPFRAQVDLKLKELTLFSNDLYAGRFPIEVGNDPAPRPGTFTVQDKQTSHTFYSANGAAIPADSPNNPYGSVWIDLGGQLSIHGSPSTTSPTQKGCISLAGDYADDLYGILSQGSSVTIRR